MVECYFCRAKVERAVALESWVPEFYRPDGECVPEPSFPTCAAARLTKDANEEFVLVDADPVKEAVKRVAERFFKWPLEAQKSDRLDFHEVACWEVEKALTAAYLNRCNASRLQLRCCSFTPHPEQPINTPSE